MLSKKQLIKQLLSEMESIQANSEEGEKNVEESIQHLESFVDYELQIMLEQMQALKERIIAFNNVKKEFDNDPFTAAGDLEELTRHEKNDKLKAALQHVFKSLG